MYAKTAIYFTAPKISTKPITNEGITYSSGPSRSECWFLTLYSYAVETYLASDTAQEDNASETDGPQSRPPITAFIQQRMCAWQCVLATKLIATIFSILATIYLGFGAGLAS
ncbi:hypothetical protein B0T17DRAFT_505618 [Bombardia bombarda]|uniref:Uncharacterized protein n=1 Tax=Bombardia bombarda TaxID=252184 RepID=A0AA39X822_9PEZI|nr:hypothetical protein B0T17DRAFT_505618 [Bombardia bombarda]